LAGHIPRLITSEVFNCPGIQVVLDGQALPIAAGSLRAIVMTDVLHHIPDPRPPSAMTTINLTSSINYTPFLAPSSATGVNGESASINYDTIARPQSSISRYGATTTYAYNDTAPATRTATTNGHWTRTTLDGFDRTTKTESSRAMMQASCNQTWQLCLS
jgi:hypothetical protein